jgi:capsular polysaccharide biosynthesis protein
VNEPERMASMPRDPVDDLPESLWAYEEFQQDREHSAVAMISGLISLSFITAAIRRGKRVWLASAVVGLLLGCGLYVKFPPAYQAVTSVLIVNNPDEDATSAIATDIELAQTRAVAARAVKALGLTESVSSFLAAYTVIAPTDEVLVFTVSAPSSAAAVEHANAVTAAFLQYRAGLLQDQQQLLDTALSQQLNKAQQGVDTLSAQISSESALPPTAAQRAQLASLRAQHTRAVTALATLEQGVDGQETNTQITTASIIQASTVLDAATPLKHSHLKAIVEYAGAALVGGLAIGLAIVILVAIMSDRLRRRDDIADALGVRVGLSVGRVRANRWIPSRTRQRGLRNRDMRRVVAYLRKAAPRTDGKAALAVVAVDSTPTVARAVLSLAVACARDGERVVLADLSRDAALARLLRVKAPGVRAVSVSGVSLVAVIPGPDDIMPIGPFGPTSPYASPTSGRQELLDAWGPADFLLTLATLDPGSGADHLTTWAADAVAVVTAGRSSTTSVHAVAELLRLSGTHLASAVLLEADKGDESLGITGSLGSDLRASSGLDTPGR